MVEYLNYIFKSVKLSCFIVILLLSYILIYIEGVVAYTTNTHISETSLREIEMKYTYLAYGIDFQEDESEKLNNVNLDKDLGTEAKDSLFSTIGRDYTIEIDKIGLNETLFPFEMTFNLEEYELENSKKDDENMIDFELLDLEDIRKGFMIGGHSSGVFTDNSHLKDVFSSLDSVVIGDKVKIRDNSGAFIEYVVQLKYVKEISETIELDNKFYIYTCYPIGTNDKRLILELERI